MSRIHDGTNPRSIKVIVYLDLKRNISSPEIKLHVERAGLSRDSMLSIEKHRTCTLNMCTRLLCTDLYYIVLSKNIPYLYSFSNYSYRLHTLTRYTPFPRDICSMPFCGSSYRREAVHGWTAVSILIKQRVDDEPYVGLSVGSRLGVVAAVNKAKSSSSNFHRYAAFFVVAWVIFIFVRIIYFRIASRWALIPREVWGHDGAGERSGAHGRGATVQLLCTCVTTAAAMTRLLVYFVVHSLLI